MAAPIKMNSGIASSVKLSSSEKSTSGIMWIFMGGMKISMKTTATPPSAKAIGMPLNSRIKVDAP